MKRHGFAGLRASHGRLRDAWAGVQRYARVERKHRSPGSIARAFGRTTIRRAELV
jgi:hypothetical protein